MNSWSRLTEGLADLAAPILPGNGRLVSDDGLLGNDEAVLAVVCAGAGNLDGWGFCVEMRSDLSDKVLEGSKMLVVTGWL